MTNRSRSQLIPIAAVILAFGLLLVRQWQATGDLASVPLDDAYIHYRFADNLAHGRGFAFNPNEPTPGSTSPLWVVLLAAGELAGLDPILASKALGALSFIACAWLTWHIAMRLTANEWIAVLAGVLVALTGRMAWAALSGMETLAFAALTLLAIYRLLEHPLNVATSALFGLAALLRPEGYLLFALAVVSDQLSVIRSQSATTGSLRSAAFRLLQNALAFSVIIAPYILFSLATTDSPLPNTFRANARELTSIEYAFQYIQYAVSDNPLAFVMAMLGILLAWLAQRRRAFREWPIVLWAIGFPIVAALLTPNLRHHGRYAIPLIPFTILLAIIGLREYIARSDARLRQRIVLVIALAGVFFGATSGWRWIETYAADARDITQMQVAMGRWIEANTPPDATLALSDIGAITYISGRRVIDLVGLVTPDILPSVAGKPVGLERDQAAFDYLARHRPDVVVIIPTWYPYLASSPGSHLTELHTVRLDHTPSVGGGDHLRAYRADWSWLEPRTSQRPTLAELGGSVMLEDFGLTPGAQVKVGSPLTVTLYWRSVQSSQGDLRPAGRFKVFIHLLDTTGMIAAQHDSEPVGDLWPTNLWRPGDAIRDDHILTLPTKLAPGRYALIAGMYDPKTQTRLLLASGGDAVTLGQVTVIGDQ